jgi:hypothetical protein
MYILLTHEPTVLKQHFFLQNLQKAFEGTSAARQMDARSKNLLKEAKERITTMLRAITKLIKDAGGMDSMDPSKKEEVCK